MATAHVNGIEIYYEREGDGRRLLFLNGSGATVATTALLVDPFRARFDVVAHDQRGLGRTEHPPEPYTMADYATDAVGLVDAIGWDTCAVFGLSFGGMVAQELAVTWPDRVERLALSCTSPGGPDLASYPLHELADLPEDERTAVGMRVLDTRFTPEWLADHPADRGLAEMMAARYTAEKSEETLRGEAAQLGARRGHDVLDRLASISCPTLVACGRYDGIAPMMNSEAIATRVPGAVLRAYEGGHAFFAQDATAIPDILDFIGGADLDPRP
jgi:3-oxoadipate enol-lactonase